MSLYPLLTQAEKCERYQEKSDNICFTHDIWEIRSQNYIVKGEHGEYTKRKSRIYREGVQTTVYISGALANEIEKEVIRWINGTSTSCRFFVNRKPIETSKISSESLVREYPWCKIYN